MSVKDDPGPASPLGLIVGRGSARIWGMESRERLSRTFRRAGLAEGSEAGRPALIVRADWIYDEALVRALARRPLSALAAPDGEIVAANAASPEAAADVAAGRRPPGLATVSAEDLVPAYDAALRRRRSTILSRLEASTVPALERRMFDGAYKGVTDIVTRYAWPRPAEIVTRWCARAGATPNQVTAASAVLTVAAFLLFWQGQFGWGLACAWAMTFLDTVDGKLARVTLTSSKWGNAFDHGIDLVHPPFWWWAWIVGLASSPTPLAHAAVILWIVTGGYVAQRIQEGVFLASFGMEIHAWRRFDSAFRLITARRNPNLLILTTAALAGRPDLGMTMVAGWTVVSFAVHAIQIVQAFIARRGGAITSWMAE